MTVVGCAVTVAESVGAPAVPDAQAARARAPRENNKQAGVTHARIMHRLEARRKPG